MVHVHDLELTDKQLGGEDVLLDGWEVEGDLHVDVPASGDGVPSL